MAEQTDFFVDENGLYKTLYDFKQEGEHENDKLPGVGATGLEKLRKAGYLHVYQMVLQYLHLERDDDRFRAWMVARLGVQGGCNDERAGQCLENLKTYAVEHLNMNL